MNKITNTARTNLLVHPVESVRQFGAQLLDEIEKQLPEIFANVALPETGLMGTAILHNDTFYLEWVFEGFRIGFSIEANTELEDHCWWAVSGPAFGLAESGGLLTDLTFKFAVGWLLTFIKLCTEKTNHV